MRVSDNGLAFIVAHEGVVPAPYLDVVNVWTFGIGHTRSAGPPDPAKMPKGMPANLDDALVEAFAVFRADLANFEADVNTILAGRTVPQHQFDAAVSFHYNTGGAITVDKNTKQVLPGATWVKSWLRGDLESAAAQIMNWTKPSAIIPRRRAEQRLFATGDYGNTTAAVWSVDRNGRIDWSKPVRSLSRAAVISLARPSGPPEPKPVSPTTPTPRPGSEPPGGTGQLPDVKPYLPWIIGAFVLAGAAAILWS